MNKLSSLLIFVCFLSGCGKSDFPVPSARPVDPVESATVAGPTETTGDVSGNGDVDILRQRQLDDAADPLNFPDPYDTEIKVLQQKLRGGFDTRGGV